MEAIAHELIPTLIVAHCRCVTTHHCHATTDTLISDNSWIILDYVAGPVVSLLFDGVAELNFRLGRTAVTLWIVFSLSERGLKLQEGEGGFDSFTEV